MKYFFRAGLAAAALLLYMYGNAKKIHKKRHTIKLETKKGFRPFRLLFIADIHRKKLPENFIVNPVDAIVIGGDLTERGVPLTRTADNLRILTAASPVFFVWGNNDEEVGERGLRKLLAHFNVTILENESVELFGNPHLKLAGVDFFSDTQEKLEKAFSKVDDDTVLFVSHTPAVFKYLRSAEDPAFMMAGHTHGGQIRVGRLGLYKKGSLKKNGSRYQLITNGYGTTSLPLRLGAEAQYHLLEFIPVTGDLLR
ncbi:metallophosphoesterase [Planococcus sp. MERTA32b]|nr:metallophosphoesterase [Planococcus sp. MER TA 32b]